MPWPNLRLSASVTSAIINKNKSKLQSASLLQLFNFSFNFSKTRSSGFARGFVRGLAGWGESLTAGTKRNLGEAECVACLRGRLSHYQYLAGRYPTVTRSWLDHPRHKHHTRIPNNPHSPTHHHTPQHTLTFFPPPSSIHMPTLHFFSR